MKPESDKPKRDNFDREIRELAEEGDREFRLLARRLERRRAERASEAPQSAGSPGGQDTGHTT